jgi:hypothetical protein
VHLDLPPIVLDFATLYLFAILLSVRGIVYAMRKKDKTIDASLVIKIIVMANLIKKDHGSLVPAMVYINSVIVGGLFLFASYLIVFHHMDRDLDLEPVLILLLITILVTHWLVSANITRRWFESAGNFIKRRLPKYYIFGGLLASERTILALVGLLALNYVALHSHRIEDFIEKATQ